MARHLTAFGVTLLCLAVLAPFAGAEDEKKKEPIPPIASDEAAAEAISVFKEEFKAKGLKGDEKLAQQDWAMRQLAVVQHRSVADVLFKQTKNRSPDLRTAAVIYLGKQRALPGYAGERVLKAMEKQSKDSTLVMAGVNAIVALEYQAASEKLKELTSHKDYSVKKHAFLAIGELRDMRLVEDIFKLLKAIKLEKGVKWDGVSVTVDTGTAGDGDQREAERLGREQMAKNKRKGKRAARNQRDIVPIVEEVLKLLTGEEFATAKMAQDWIKANDPEIKKASKRLDEIAAKQIAEANAK